MPPRTAAEMQRRLGGLLDHMPAGVVVHGSDGRILNANALACELIGTSIEQLRGMAFDGSDCQLLLPDGTPMPQDQFPVNAVLRTRQKQSQILLGFSRPGSEIVRWLICNAYPELDAEGSLYRVIVCFTDCTSLKQAEHDRHKSEERLRLVLQGSTDAPWDYDLTTDEMYYSERWWNMLGYSLGELSATPTLWYELMHPDDRSRVENLLQEVLAGQRKGYSFEFRLRHREGHYVPILSRGFVSRDSCGKALRLSGTNTDLTERKLAEERIYKLANFDHLTGLPNRRLLIEELDKALARSKRSGSFGAVVFLDLDNFKLLNDTMGHDLGDVLLRRVAERLRSTLRHSDQVARLGGDEFVLVLEDLGTEIEGAATEAHHVLLKLQEALRQPYYLSDRTFLSTSSIGITLFDGVASNIETLLKQADLAMYQAKTDGRNTTRFFDPHMQYAAEQQAALEHALREGLSAHQFVLFCQPQFSCVGTLIGAEVLVRWHRDGGLFGPDEFISLAESSGMIVPLGEYILAESCRALARWQNDDMLKELKLAVNISARQVHNDNFVAMVGNILRLSGAPAGKLCLELTESVFAGNIVEIIERMRSLCSMDVHFSLDDFGTGYSSLAYLKRFPLAALKIDRSFVRDVHLDPDAPSFIEAIIALAHKLKLEVVAEGVEHEDQRSFLVNSGCNSLQGYLLGRPMPIADFEKAYGSKR